MIEAVGEGIDKVYASVNYTLAAGQEVEKLVAHAGSTGLTLTGNTLDNSLYGRAGQDTLIGGDGADRLIGDTDADTFIFQALSQSTVASTGRDTIVDFSQVDADKIDVSLIDANSGASADQAFVFISAAAFSGVAGELRSEATTTNTIVWGDVNGDAVADFAVTVQGVISLHTSDFIL